MASLTQWTGVWVSSGSWRWRETWHAAVHGVAKSQTRLSDWTELKSYYDWYPYKRGNLDTSMYLLVSQSCPALWHPMDYSPPGFSVHGIYQARILEWVAISFSRGSSQPRDQTRVSCIASQFFTIWATSEVMYKPTGESSLSALRRHQPFHHFDLRLLAFRTVRQISVVWTSQGDSWVVQWWWLCWGPRFDSWWEN